MFDHSSEQTVWEQTRSAIHYLPRSQESFFRNLWEDRRLRFEGAHSSVDQIDHDSAKLVCAALSTRKPLLLVLPDESPRRMPLLFATGLVMHMLDHHLRAPEHHLVYFGQSAAIKSYLSQTFIREQSMAGIVNQITIGRNRQQIATIAAQMPHVVFSYAPPQAETVLRRFKPKWVFLDCGSGEKGHWLKPLLPKLIANNIPSIACIQNPLAPIIDTFRHQGWEIFDWTPQSSIADQPVLCTPYLVTDDTTTTHLEQASYSLYQASRQAKTRFQHDVVGAVRHYLRTLEQLAVPLSFYEAECSNYWGIHSVARLQDGAQQFVEACGGDISRNLQPALTELNTLHNQWHESDPPLWDALRHLIIDPPDASKTTLLIFPNRTQKQLFAFGLLALDNIAEHELADLNVWITDLKQAANWKRDIDTPANLPKPCDWMPILLGTPAQYRYPLYAHLLEHPALHAVLYPHQQPLMAWHIDRWNQRLSARIAASRKVLDTLSSRPLASVERYTVRKRILLNETTEVAFERKPNSSPAAPTALLQLNSRIAEWDYLMSEDDAVDEAATPIDSPDQNETNAPIYCQQIVHLACEGGYELRLAPHETVQVVVTANGKRQRQDRTARSLRAGDTLLYIHGQRRQNLYDLILSRIHDHPNFVLHISLLNRWREELIAGYRAKHISPTELLSQMQEKGSSLTSTQTIRTWLTGAIMSPLDGQDLQRVAQILELPFVAEHHDRINRAAVRLRTLHRVLARQLNSWLHRDALSNDADSFNALVDSELGLDFRDFRESLLLLRISSSTIETGLFLTSSLGHLTHTGDVQCMITRRSKRNCSTI